MKRLHLLLAFGLLAATGGRAIAAAADQGSDAAWLAYENAGNARPPKSFSELSPRERAQWIEQHFLRRRELGLAFIEQFPTDPRRWRIVVGFMPEVPRFITDWNSVGADGDLSHATVDRVAVAAWQQRVAELRAELSAALAQAADVPPDVRQAWFSQEVLRPIRAAAEAQAHGEPVDLPALRAKLDAFAAAHPDNPAGGAIADSYMRFVQQLAPATLETEWRALAASPNAALAKQAKAKVAFYDITKQPIELAFTAADGREVDVAKLRGKVVLIDFWATWCGPCKKEIPNIKRVYAAYRDKGFEVVGIALENARLQPNDTPEQHAEKLAKAKTKLMDFTAQNGMPWPQYFDGKHWKNDIVTRYAIDSIPAMFLLDQTGRIVSTDARGERLAAEVKRLLKL